MRDVQRRGGARERERGARGSPPRSSSEMAKGHAFVVYELCGKWHAPSSASNAKTARSDGAAAALDAGQKGASPQSASVAGSTLNVP